VSLLSWTSVMLMCESQMSFERESKVKNKEREKTNMYKTEEAQGGRQGGESSCVVSIVSTWQEASPLRM